MDKRDEVLTLLQQIREGADRGALEMQQVMALLDSLERRVDALQRTVEQGWRHHGSDGTLN